MKRKSQLDLAIESLEHQIEIKQLALDELLKVQAGKPTRVRKPKAVPSIERSA